MSLPAVGVIGTGAMGLGVVQSLSRHGIRTFTRDIRNAANASAQRYGATPVDSPAALAGEVELVFLLVVDAAQIDDVMFGESSAASALRAGGIVAVCSTVDPTYVADLAARLLEYGITVVDAPVSGGPAKAADATMTMMVAGAADARARCAPVFARIAGKVFTVGDTPGQAATFKIVNNLLAAANLAAGAEALALASRAGIDQKAALDVICASSGASWMVADRMSRALAGDTSVRAATRILAKDVGIALRLAQRLGIDAPFARMASQAFRDAVDAGYGDADDSALLELCMLRGTAARPFR